MRRILPFLYLVAILVVIVVLARSCFTRQTTQIADRVRERVPVVAGPKESPRPADAARFTDIPDTKLLASDSLSRKTYDELTERYRAAIIDFKRATDEIGAQLVIVTFGTEVGRYASPAERRGQPVVAAAAKAAGVPYYDFSTPLSTAVDHGGHISLMPKDGHLSREGAAIVAEQLAAVVRAFDGHRSTKTFTAGERPATFGDIEPGQDHVVDQGKGLPYLLKTNRQGLRMDSDVTFPKTKQRVLLMGSSTAYFPFLDNDRTGSGLLQHAFPDKEILNAAVWAYSPIDELTLFEEKAKFAEPDVVILQQSGEDILNLFFTHQNLFDRKKEYHAPTPLERAYYEATYPK